MTPCHTPTPCQNVISFSGGKDSTAMALLMLEKGEPTHSIVAFDTGWEFPQMYEHWDKFERHTGLKITVLKPERPFTYWMFEREVVARKGERKGGVHRIGNGWPSPMRRWCTRQKVEEINKYLRNIENPISCVGIAADEAHRVKDNSKYPCRYPLIEWDIDEPRALEICQHHGFDWGGLYGFFKRVSCFCCPLQRKGELKKVRKHFPELWAKMLEWDKSVPGHNRGFKDYDTVHDLEAQFAEDDRRLVLPFCVGFK
jgi:3'-phosphoadenosine 5'-phosphosulfate sulfotransferase (PAPS reductase)/FAD synthetase